jgi:hypothetical protein
LSQRGNALTLKQFDRIIMLQRDPIAFLKRGRARRSMFQPIQKKATLRADNVEIWLLRQLVTRDLGARSSMR